MKMKFENDLSDGVKAITKKLDFTLAMVIQQKFTFYIVYDHRETYLSVEEICN